MERPPLRIVQPSHDFEQAAEPEFEHVGPEIDAANWEPLHEPDEHNFDPPIRVYDPDHLMAPSPFGTIDVEVQRELDADAQRAIHEAQQRDPEQGMALPHDLEASDSRDVYQAEHADYERRLMDRFQHAQEHEHEHDHELEP